MFTITTTTDSHITNDQSASIFSSFAQRISPAVALKACAVGYWGVFWVMNGLDKFLNRTDLGLFTWHGKDRTNQFTEYFDRIDVPVEAIDPVLFFAGLWEFVVAAPFLLVLTHILRGIEGTRTESILSWGYVLTAGTFVAFSGFDVIAGDRAELREHGLYLALMFGCVFFTSAGNKRLAH